jgi:hypothetical protein
MVGEGMREEGVSGSVIVLFLVIVLLISVFGREQDGENEKD